MCLSNCAARKRAQRAKPADQKCQECGSTNSVEGHHPDIDGLSMLVIYLCRKCHAKADQLARKRWKNPKKHVLNKVCEHCGNLVKEQRDRVRFCSRTCAIRYKAAKAKAEPVETRTECLVCNRPIKGRIRPGRRFCSRSCATIHRNSL